MADPLWDKAQLDPTYLAGHSGLRNAIISAANAYGDPATLFARPPGVDPATGQPYQTIAEQYGITSQDVSGAAANPYSTVAGLRKQLAGDQGQITTGLASRGLEFSGAHAAMQAKEVNDANQRNYDASQGLSSTLAGIGQQNSNLISGAYQTLMGQAANDPTIPAPAAAPAAPAPAAPAPPPPGATNATANWNANPGGYNPYAPQNAGNGIVQPIKVKKPVLGGMGHIT